MLYRSIWVTLLSLVTSGHGDRDIRGAPSLPRYEMAIEILPSDHTLVVDGTVELPSSALKDGTARLLISGSAGPIEWQDADLNAGPIKAASTVGEDGVTAWTVTGRWTGKDRPIVRFRYRLKTAKAEQFLYVGPEMSFGAGGFYPEIEGFDDGVGILRITAPAGELASVGAPVKGVREGDRLTKTFTTDIPSEFFFGYAPGPAATASLSPRLSLTTLQSRAGHKGWRDGLSRTAAALEGEFGPIPYEHVTVFEVPETIADQAGFGAFAASGAVIVRSAFLDQPYNVAALAHEFTHLWWGNFVGLNGKKGDYLLDEGLAQYGSMIAVDRILGAEAGARYRRQGVPGFNESLYGALGYLKIVAAGMDRPLLALEDDGLSYWIAYSKAGLAWTAVAQEMGAARFSSALKAVVRDRGASGVSWDQFIAALQRESPRDLQPLLDDWFTQPGAPEYVLETGHSKRPLEGTIIQHATRKRATLEVAASGCGPTVRLQRVQVSSAHARFRLPGSCHSPRLLIDPNYKILRWTPQLRAEAGAAAQHMRASVLSRLGRNDQAERVLNAAIAEHPRNDEFDTAILTHSLLSRLLLERGCRNCAVDHVSRALSFRPAKLERLPLTYLGLATRAKLLGRQDLAVRAAAEARIGDKLVAGANGIDLKLRKNGL